MRRCILYIFVSKTVIKGPSKQVRICVRIAYKLTRVLIILMTPITTDVNTYQKKKKLQATFVQEIVHGIVWRLVHIIAHELKYQYIKTVVSKVLAIR